MDTITAVPVRLNIGCGANTLPGWINIDHYAGLPGVTEDVDATDMPYADGSVDAILAEHVLEHFSLAEERLVWREMARVLRPGGTLTVEVPDFEWVCSTFLSANDDWREFYVVGATDHYAGCGRALDQRWGILQTMFFGNQNGTGQYRLFNKGGQALRARLER
jgi:predicted SAM-dependent methyltransferase